MVELLSVQANTKPGRAQRATRPGVGERQRHRGICRACYTRLLAGDWARRKKSVPAPVLQPSTCSSLVRPRVMFAHRGSCWPVPADRLRPAGRAFATPSWEVAEPTRAQAVLFQSRRGRGAPLKGHGAGAGASAGIDYRGQTVVAAAQAPAGFRAAPKLLIYWLPGLDSNQRPTD